MKKFLACILVLSMLVLVFASCGNTEKKGNTENEREQQSDIDDGVDDSSEDETTEKNLIPSTEGLEFQLNEDGKSYSLIGIGACTSTDIVIGAYRGLPVTTIYSGVFRKYSNIESFKISECVVSIGEDAFEGCTKALEYSAVQPAAEKAFF